MASRTSISQASAPPGFPQPGTPGIGPGRPYPWAIPEGTRIFAIGDVHGRADLLLSKLEAIYDVERARPVERSEVVILGDLIDRGPNSAGCLDLISALAEHRPVVALLGNHEIVARTFLADESVYAEWLAIGGAATLASYGVPAARRGTTPADVQLALLERMPERHRALLDGLRPSFTCGDYVFVHAGLRPGVPLAAQSLRDLTTIRGEFLEADAPFEHCVVHGHTPVRYPEVRPFRINIDTGAYATGRLTCLVLEGDSVAFL
jgi:serine/threonine protein phosphatase 1